MELFPIETNLINVLPYDGESIYYGQIIEPQEATRYFESLWQTIAWKNDEAVIFGKHLITKRKVAWYGDSGFSYTYSKTTKQALPWTADLLELKALVEQLTDTSFNSCLLNLYHNGDEGMGWHSDDEKSLAPDSAIASVSLGAERKFSFRHKQTKETRTLTLASGTLLVMQGTTQTHWHHCLPKAKKVTSPRINLTFRTMV
ncbi:MAG: alpha-ketoglutarate-dependent dioxygenase AlkB [Spirosomataceae bacterium]